MVGILDYSYSSNHVVGIVGYAFIGIELIVNLPSDLILLGFCFLNHQYFWLFINHFLLEKTGFIGASHTPYIPGYKFHFECGWEG